MKLFSNSSNHTMRMSFIPVKLISTFRGVFRTLPNINDWAFYKAT